MFEIPLHLGYEHPSLLWVVIPSVLSFAAGVGIGMRARNRTDSPESSQVPDHE